MKIFAAKNTLFLLLSTLFFCPTITLSNFLCFYNSHSYLALKVVYCLPSISLILSIFFVVQSTPTRPTSVITSASAVLFSSSKDDWHNSSSVGKHSKLLHNNSSSYKLRKLVYASPVLKDDFSSSSKDEFSNGKSGKYCCFLSSSTSLLKFFCLHNGYSFTSTNKERNNVSGTFGTPLYTDVHSFFFNTEFNRLWINLRQIESLNYPNKKELVNVELEKNSSLSEKVNRRVSGSYPALQILRKKNKFPLYSKEDSESYFHYHMHSSRPYPLIDTKCTAVSTTRCPSQKTEYSVDFEDINGPKGDYLQSATNSLQSTTNYLQSEPENNSQLEMENSVFPSEEAYYSVSKLCNSEPHSHSSQNPHPRNSEYKYFCASRKAAYSCAYLKIRENNKEATNLYINGRDISEYFQGNIYWIEACVKPFRALGMRVNVIEDEMFKLGGYYDIPLKEQEEEKSTFFSSKRDDEESMIEIKDIQESSLSDVVASDGLNSIADNLKNDYANRTTISRADKSISSSYSSYNSSSSDNNVYNNELVNSDIYEGADNLTKHKNFNNISHPPPKSNFKDNSFDVYIKAHGGGLKGQAEAAGVAISKSIVSFDPTLKKLLRDSGLITTDARRVERKKPGLRKSRKRPQYSKR